VTGGGGGTKRSSNNGRYRGKRAGCEETTIDKKTWEGGATNSIGSAGFLFDKGKGESKGKTKPGQHKKKKKIRGGEGPRGVDTFCRKIAKATVYLGGKRRT